MSENVKILKIKLLKGGERVVFVLKESGTVQATDSKECENPVHPDFLNAIQALAPHLAILTDFIEPKQVNDADEIEKFTVTGYSRKEKQGVEGVVITGMRKTKSGQKYAINSPFTTFNSEGEEQYILVNDLISKLDAADSEGRSYLFDGKMLQPSLFDGSNDAEFEDDDETVTHMQILGQETQEEKDQKVLSHLRNGAGHADPDAMERVSKMGTEEDPIGGAIGELVQEHNQKTKNGKGSRGSKSNGKKK